MAGDPSCRRRARPGAWPRTPTRPRSRRPGPAAGGRRRRRPEPEVLAPQPQPQLAGEDPRLVPESSRVGRLAEIGSLVHDGAGDLGVMGPGAAVEVGRAHHGPHVVDHHRLGVDIDRRALLVLEVVDGHSRPPGADQVVNGPPLGSAGSPTGDPPVTVGMPRHDDDHAQLGSAAQGGREGVADQRAPQVLVLDVDQRPGPPQGLQVGPGDAALAVGRERGPPVPGRIGAQHLHGMGAGLGRWQPPLQQPQAPGLVADPPPHGPQRVAMVAGGAVLPALPEGEVDIQHGRAAQLQLEVVPGRPPTVAGVDPDRVGVAEMPGVVTTAAGQVDATDEGDAAVGVVGAVVGHQLPPARLTSVLSTRLASWLNRTRAGWERHSSPPDGHSAAGEGGQQRPQLAARAGQLAGGVDAPVGQVHPVAGAESGQQLVQPPEVGGSIHMHHDPVPSRPGLAVTVLGVDGLAGCHARQRSGARPRRHLGCWQRPRPPLEATSRLDRPGGSAQCCWRS